MANYSVDVDFVMSKTIEVEAESEEQAMSIARSKIEKNPYDFAHGFSHCVSFDITGANEG